MAPSDPSMEEGERLQAAMQLLFGGDDPGIQMFGVPLGKVADQKWVFVIAFVGEKAGDMLNDLEVYGRAMAEERDADFDTHPDFIGVRDFLQRVRERAAFIDGPAGNA